jgi:hypothetical protein
MTEEIKVTIERNGKVTLQVIGRQGSKCLQVTEEFEGKIGNVLDRRRTHEFYQAAIVPIVLKNLNPRESA